jgi:hypothetical protein
VLVPGLALNKIVELFALIITIPDPPALPPDGLFEAPPPPPPVLAAPADPTAPPPEPPGLPFPAIPVPAPPPA